LLTGRTPFTETQLGILLAQIQLGEFRHPRQVNRHIPAPLDAICRKAMSLVPADRYATALALAADIDHWLADEPVGAYPEPLRLRARRWARKHRALVSSAAAVLLVAAVGSTIAAFVVGGLNRQLRQRDDFKKLLAELEGKTNDKPPMPHKK
jgi:hypothetical protein